MTDPIADMLTRIRNASAVKKQEVIIPFSKIKYEISKILEAENLIEKVEKNEDNSRVFVLKLKYNNNKSAINSLKRISKPGRRVYVAKDEMPYVLNNLGIAIISTSQGLMTNKQARKKGVGGELICEIY